MKFERANQRSKTFSTLRSRTEETNRQRTGQNESNSTEIRGAKVRDLDVRARLPPTVSLWPDTGPHCVPGECVRVFLPMYGRIGSKGVRWTRRPGALSLDAARGDARKTSTATAPTSTSPRTGPGPLGRPAGGGRFSAPRATRRRVKKGTPGVVRFAGSTFNRPSEELQLNRRDLRADRGPRPPVYAAPAGSPGTLEGPRGPRTTPAGASGDGPFFADYATNLVKFLASRSRSWIYNRWG